jgi:hypothetical protein
MPTPLRSRRHSKSKLCGRPDARIGEADRAIAIAGRLEFGLAERCYDCGKA